MVRPVVVLLHGFLGFVKWGPFEYFRGVKDALCHVDIDPLTPEVPTAGTIAERAEVLAHKLFRSNTPAFALVGHSMGGLDARYLITHLDPDRRIKSLITVSTPHQGSPLARWFLESRGPIQAYIRHIGDPGLRELTPEACRAMHIPDRDDVHYMSYASCRPPGELPFWLRPYGRAIDEDNDGLVPVSSAQWGQFRGVVRSDHIELIGWSLGLPDAQSGRPFDHLAFWTRVAAEATAAAERDNI
ncbi:thioesterase [Nitrosovibrio tenuis]|uniref:Triacylglycerol lipase n=1 Tax=Nitrosovibrio tenuis TaxID=1233 RepID=A0A1H7K9J4_9PROT|nr:thioesterase [Nitrosovibrio tenuis]SEK83553.1 triacylglycerol lipase [Nitrosovibrio tenuis]